MSVTFVNRRIDSFLIAAALLGCISFGFIFYLHFRTAHITEEQRVFSDYIRQANIQVATSHLWLEEYLSGDTSIDADAVLVSLTQTLALIDEAAGNAATAGYPNLLKDLNRVRALIVQLNEISMKRIKEVETSGIGTDIDQRHDAVFGQVESVFATMHEFTAAHLMDERNRQHTIHYIIASVWVLIVIVVIVFLRRELALRDALEQKRRESETRYRSLVETANDAILSADSGGKIVSWNKGAKSVFGYAEEEALGQPLTILMPERYRALYRKGFDRFFSTGEKSIIGNTVEFTGLRKNNAEFPMEISLSTWEAGEKTFITGIVRDIAERKRAEETLKESERRYRETLENVSLIAVQLDTKGAVRFANDYLLALTGWSAEEVLGKNWFKMFLPEQESDRVLQVFLDIIEKDAPHHSHYENPIVTRDGELRHVSWNNTTLRDVNGAIIGTSSIGEDITERKKAERALRESSRLLQESQRVANLGSYTFDVLSGMWSSSTILDSIFGIADSEFTRDVEGWLKIVHPDQREEMQEYLRVHVIGERTRFDREYRIVRLDDGQERWVHGLGELTLDQEGRAVKMIGTIQDITDRKRAEETLQESEQKYRSLFEAAGDAIFILTASGEREPCFVDCNSRALSMFGCAREDMIGKTPGDFSPEFQPNGRHSREIILESARLAREGKRQHFEYTHSRLDGSAFPTEVTISRVVVENEVFYQGIVRDITERKKAEEALRRSEEKYRNVVELAQEGIWVIDKDGNTTFANPSMANMLGYGVEEMQGKHLFYFMDERGVEIAKKHIEHRQQGIKEQHDFEFLHKDGHRVYTTIETAPITDDEGNYIGAIAGAIDITERKKAEEALRESEQRLRQLSESAFEGMVIAEEGKIIECNENFAHIFGYTHDEIIGLTAMDLAAPGSRELVAKNIAGGYEGIFEIEGVRKDGSIIPLEAHGVAAPYHGRTARITAIRDISERKKAEEERKSLEAQLQHAQKLKSLGVLAGGIAHDFNNILLVIMGNASLALDDLSPVSPVRKNIEEIEQASKRAATLTRQMLAYSGKGTFDVRTLDLNEIVREMAHLFESSISKKAALTFNLAGGLPPIEADAAQVQQIVMNLITNASEAIGDKNGVISVTTEARECDHAYLNDLYLAEELPEGLYACLEVSDTGSGMDEETMKKVFDPFFTTKFTGRGLGMSAVLGIVRGHKGGIKIDSEPGRGSIFTVYFPVSEKQVIKQTGRYKEALAKWRGEGKVLLVDDEEQVRIVGAKVLEKFGFTVIQAVDGVDAVEKFRDHADEIVCVLLDLMMPRMNGVECLRRLRQLKEDLPIIMASGYSEEEVAGKFEGAGPDAFANKPYDVLDLMGKIRRAIESRGA